MQYSKFAVDEKAWCLWDWDLARRNLYFLNSIDAMHFNYLARAYVNFVDSDQDQHNAGLAFRMTYSHGLETFFAFLFAAIQAPDCALGWVHKYGVADLASLLEKVNAGQPILSKIKIDPVTWENIANSILMFNIDDKEKEKRIKQSFATAWEKLAKDFLEPLFRPEYNSIKHGLRAKSGGFQIAMGRENLPGSPALPNQMHLVGESEFGSTFFTAETLDVETTNKAKRQFIVLKHSRGWKIENFYFGLNLISLSLLNVLSFLKILNGVDASQVEFAWPDDETHFQEPWKTWPSASEMSMNNIITPEHITPFSNEEILSIYDNETEDGQNNS